MVQDLTRPHPAWIIELGSASISHEPRPLVHQIAVVLHLIYPVRTGPSLHPSCVQEMVQNINLHKICIKLNARRMDCPELFINLATRERGGTPYGAPSNISLLCMWKVQERDIEHICTASGGIPNKGSTSNTILCVGHCWACAFLYLCPCATAFRSTVDLRILASPTCPTLVVPLLSRSRFYIQYIYIYECIHITHHTTAHAQKHLHTPRHHPTHTWQTHKPHRYPAQ